MWQLVQLMLPGAYSGRLSAVCMTRASPRRMDAPSESFGIMESAGGCHVAGSKTAPAWLALATVGALRCVSLPDSETLHAAAAERHVSAMPIVESLEDM